MRLLQVVHGLPPRQIGGTENHAYDLSRELARRHDVYVLYPVHEGRRLTLRSYTQDGLEFYELNVPSTLRDRIRRNIRINTSYRNEQLDETFRRILDQVDPDVVHFQHVIYLSASFVQIAKSTGVPTVMTLHDCWLLCPMINLMRYDYMVCKGPDKEGRKCQYCWSRQRAQAISDFLWEHSIPTKLTRKPLEYILRTVNQPRQFRKRSEYMKDLLLGLNVAIFPSKSLMKLFFEHGLSARQSIQSEPGYDLARFRDFRKRKKGREFVFGYLGGIARHKGVDVLVEAFSTLNDDKAELAIYGDCASNKRHVRDVQAKTTGRKIHIRGTATDVTRVYLDTDIVVIPSICYEVASLVLFEALTTRTPVIASNVGGLSEFVAERRAGLLFEIGDSHDLTEKMRLVVNHSDTLLELSSGIAQPPRSLKEQAQELDEVYRKLIRSRESRQLLKPAP